MSGRLRMGVNRLALAVALALAIGLTLPEAAWAHRGEHGFHGGSSTGCCVFIGPGRDVAPRPFFSPPGSTFIVSPAAWAWVPGFWWWDGWQWEWVPGRWIAVGGVDP